MVDIYFPIVKNQRLRNTFLIESIMILNKDGKGIWAKTPQDDNHNKSRKLCYVVDLIINTIINNFINASKVFDLKYKNITHNFCCNFINSNSSNILQKLLF